MALDTSQPSQETESRYFFTKGNQYGKLGGRPRRDSPRGIANSITHNVVKDVSKAAATHSALAIQTLHKALKAKNCPWATKVTAAQALLDRAFGKPREFIQHENKLSLEALVLAAMNLDPTKPDPKLIEHDPPDIQGP